jgi:acyl carrier protein
MSTGLESEVANAIAAYVMRAKAPAGYTQETLPRDRSLIQLGVLDSFGVIELVEFLETFWNIRIDDTEVTTERMGSIEKMAKLVAQKKQ